MKTQHTYFWPPDAEGKRDWLVHWNVTITSTLITKYGIASADITYLQNAEPVLNYLIEIKTVADTWSQSITEKRDGMFSLPPSTTLTLPADPALPAPPIAAGGATLNIVCGLDATVARIAAQIKRNPAYDVADGELLGIEGPAIPPPDPATTKPELSAKIVTGGVPELRVKLSPFRSWELWADFGTGTFAMVQVALHSRLLCGHPLPAAGQSAVWKFKAIYRDGNAHFGQFSDVLPVTVSGS